MIYLSGGGEVYIRCVMTSEERRGSDVREKLHPLIQQCPLPLSLITTTCFTWLMCPWRKHLLGTERVYTRVISPTLGTAETNAAYSVMFSSLWPHRLYPVRLLYPWNSPGKNTGVGCLSYSRGSSWTRDQIQVSCVSCIGRWIFYLLDHLENLGAALL